MKANNNTIEITNGVEYRVILSIEGKKNQITIFTTRKGAKAAIKEMERDLEATNTGYVIRLICNVYEDGELVTNSELGKSQFDPSKVITVKVTPTDTMNTETKTMNEVIANTPANLSKLHALAAAETPMFYIWLDAVDDAATTSVYLTEAAARADIARLENDDKDAGVYEPDAYSIINAAPYFL